MSKGIVFALGACFVWGLIFVIPQFMEGFSSIEIALGRYFFYALISVLIFARSRLSGTFRYPLSIWIKAVSFALLCSIGYFTFVVLALRYSTPAITALILGISPISIAFYGNWRQKECTYKSLMLPSVLILVGLIVINLPHISTTESPSEYFMGLGCCFMALVLWTWYAVANSEFLKNTPQMQSSDWSTLVGIGNLFWVIVCGSTIIIFDGDQINVNKYLTFSAELKHYLIGCCVLGCVCSWVGAYLWNTACYYLPVSLAGQLMVFETIFGVAFVYILKQDLPPQMEWLGMTILISAVIYGIRNFSPSEDVIA